MTSLIGSLNSYMYTNPGSCIEFQRNIIHLCLLIREKEDWIEIGWEGGVRMLNIIIVQLNARIVEVKGLKNRKKD
jgi:hypothetical protein